MLSTKFRPAASRCTLCVFHKRHISEFKNNLEILTKYFHLPSAKAKKFIESKNLGTRKPANVMNSIEYCKMIGFEDQDILNNPSLLTTHPLTLEHRYLAMKEGGFDVIAPAVLAKFLVLLKKPVETLKSLNYIKKTTDVAKSFIEHLKPCPEDFSVGPISESKAWIYVHSKIMREYLKWRLQINDDAVDRLLLVHRGVKYKSFQILCENLSIAEELGFPTARILKCGYLLHSDPKRARTALTKYPNIVGADMKVAMRLYPKLVTTSPASIERIYKILKEHNVADETIRKRINVFHMSPETVEFRLKELERVKDLKVLMSNPAVLKLVVHHNRARSRLDFLKKLDLACSGVGVLGNDAGKFEKHVKTGHDSNSPIDVTTFLKGVFGRDPKEFLPRLRRHPRFLEVPLVVMEETYHYLSDLKFTPQAIFKVIWILLYSKEYIQDAFEEVTEFEKTRKDRNLTEIVILNLMLYFLEKDYYFRGCGIKKKADVTDEFDDVVSTKVKSKC